jgi:hypothetical protein
MEREMVEKIKGEKLAREREKRIKEMEMENRLIIYLYY